MTDPITISTDIPVAGMDYARLRQEAQDLIGTLAGDGWSDYNLTDPGITQMEALAYIITDLSYRLGFEMKDLLTDNPDLSSVSKQFFTAREILTVNPLTANDYRKLVIDVKGVKNAWVEKSEKNETNVVYDPSTTSVSFPFQAEVTDGLRTLNGLYRVLIELDGTVTNTETVLASVYRRLNANRNLAEDFVEVSVLADDILTITGEVEIDRHADINEIFATLYFQLQTYLSPSLTFYSLSQRLALGHKIEDIFQGPPLDHGFLLDEELAEFERKTEVHSADIISILLNVEGITDVKALSLSEHAQSPVKWILQLSQPDTERPVLKPIADFIDAGDITFFTKEGVTTPTVDKSIVMEKVSALQAAVLDAANISRSLEDTSVPAGTYHDFTDYTSVQNEFPKNYGIGSNGLPASASDLRQAQAKQLKSYLMVFDQLLLNYLAQLGHMKELFAVAPVSQPPSGVVTTEDINPTYLTETLASEVAGVADLITDYDSELVSGYAYQLQQMVEDETVDVDRGNRFLDHLLARHGEGFTSASTLFPELTSTTATASTLPSSSVQVIPAKQRYIQDYIEVSRDRNKSFDYTDADNVWNTDNVSGLKKRIARLLDIQDPSRRTLAYPLDPADPLAEGFHEIDHILLRPDLPVGYVETFTTGALPGELLCQNTEEHGLENGDLISFVDTTFGNYVDDTYTISVLDDKSFTVSETYTSNTQGAESGFWISELQTQEPALSFLNGIETIEQGDSMLGSDDFYTRFELLRVHELADGDQIVIAGASETIGSLNDIHTVFNVGTTHFDIDLAFQTEFSNTINTQNVSWYRFPIYGDPYSCQISYIFPKDIGRARDNSGGQGFRDLVAEVIREQTPAHIKPYLCFLEDGDLEEFEYDYQIWLTAKAAEQTNHQKIATTQRANILFDWLCQYSSGTLVLHHHFSASMAVDGNSTLTFEGINLLEVGGLAADDDVTTTVSIEPDVGTLSASSFGDAVVTAGSVVIAGSVTDVNVVLRNMTYSPEGYNGTVILTMQTVVTSSGSIITDTATITAEAAPVNSLSFALSSVVQGEDLILDDGVSNTITVTDSSPAITCVISVDYGTLTATTGGGAVISNNDNASVTISGTSVQINAALDGLIYHAPDAGVYDGIVAFSLSTDDGFNTPVIDNANLTVNFSTAPVNSVPAAQQVDPNSDLIFNLANSNLISVSDVDLTEVETVLSIATGTLDVIASGHGATVTNDNTSSVTIVGSPTQVNAALDGLTYHAAGVVTTETLTVVTTDNSGLMDTDVVTIVVNGFPLNTVPVAQKVLQGNDLIFNIANNNLIWISDDSPSITSTISVIGGNNGTLTATTGGGAIITNNDTASVSVSGTASQINAALDGMIYHADPGTQVTDTLTIMTDDSVNTVVSDDVAITVDDLTTSTALSNQLSLWLDAGDLSTISKDGSDNIISWSDKSTNGYVATVAALSTAPLYVTSSVINATPAIRFDSSESNLLNVGDVVLGADNISDEASIIIVFQMTTQDSNSALLNKPASSATPPGSSYHVGFRPNNDDSLRVFFGINHNINNVHSSGISYINTYIRAYNGLDGSVTVYSNGNTLQVFLGVVGGIPPYDGVYTYNDLFIGNREPGDNNGFIGDVAEIIIYNRALTTAEQGMVETYLSSKYGITLS